MLDASEIADDRIACDVAIVGAGPAGLAVAAELASTGADVVVLEAGGMPYDRSDRANTWKAVRDHWSGAQSLTRGVGSGEPYFPLRMSRARGVGGSSNALRQHGLRGRPMDPVDFGPRFGSSWPIAHREFSEFLGRAEELSGMAAPGRAVDWASESIEVGGAGSSKIVAAPFAHGDRYAFAELGRRLSVHRAIRVITSAVVVRVSTDGVGAVRDLTVASLSGATLGVRARRYVLAAGAIDNARLLLDSQPVLHLMGAAAEHVGRHFMEHLHYVPAFWIPGSRDVADDLSKLVGNAERPLRWLVLDDQIVVREELLRLAFLPVPVQESSLHPAVPAFGELARMFPYGPFGMRGRLRQVATAMAGLPHVVRAMVDRLGRSEAGSAFALSVMAEQFPDPESRVTLSGRTDRLGSRLPRLHWRVGTRDFEDARRSTELLAEEFETMGIGRVVGLWDRGLDRPPVVTGGWHHMGTTRMADGPDEGVVDRECRVFGLDNLYVAGSSVFPTSGYANPTLTLVALAVRLGRNLGSQSRGS